MSKIKLLTSCPGCNDAHVGIVCRKPSFIVPVMVTANCDHCTSTILYRVTLPRGRKSAAEIAVQPIKFRASEELLRLLETQAALKQLNEIASQPTEGT